VNRLLQIDAEEMEKERRIEEALKRIEQLNIGRSDSCEVCLSVYSAVVTLFSRQQLKVDSSFGCTRKILL